MKRAILLVGLVAACGGSGLRTLAEETCDQLDGAIMLVAGTIISRAVADATEAGYSAPELGAAMREECPGLMASLDEFLADQETQDNLINEVDLVLDSCTLDGANGTVKNNSTRTVTVFIDISYLDSDRVLIDTGVATVRGLQPGQTGRWDSSFFGDGLARCESDLSSVFES